MASLARGAAPVREHHPLQIREAASGTIRYGFSFATGLVFRAMQEYYRRPNPGMPDALRASALPLWAVLTGRPFYANIQLDLATPDGPWMSESPHTILASVFENPLLWFRPFAGQLGPPPAFHLAATSMRPREIATRMWSTFQGRCRHPRLRTGSCLKATVRGNVGYVIDGDLYSVDGRVDVVITPGPPVRFLAPS
jgi:hypothetical protein